MAQGAAREHAAALAAANANLEALRQRCARLEAQLAEPAPPLLNPELPGGNLFTPALRFILATLPHEQSATPTSCMTSILCTRVPGLDVPRHSQVILSPYILKPVQTDFKQGGGETYVRKDKDHGPHL